MTPFSPIFASGGPPGAADFARRKHRRGRPETSSRHGEGALRETAADAARRGYRALHCLTQRDNEALVGVVRKAGLGAVPLWYDGLLHIEIPLAVAAEVPQPA
jgi:hypothetical protein